MSKEVTAYDSRNVIALFFSNNPAAVTAKFNTCEFNQCDML